MRRLGLVLVVLLLAGAGLVMVLQSGAGNGDTTDARGEGTGERAPHGAAKANRERGERTTTRSAAQRLRALLDGAPSEAPGFAEVDRLARGLSDAELQVLIAEVGFTDEEGLEGWVRSALFAEWGRRDPEAAWDYLREPPAGDLSTWALEQAHFALWRGWAENDPAEAASRLRFEDLASIRAPGRPSSRGGVLAYWRGYAYTEVFRQFARSDAEAAWEALSADNRRKDALAGFFAGLPDQASLRGSIDRWVGDWLSEESLAAHEEYVAQLNGARSGVVAIPPNETIAHHAAVALAEFHLDAALTWIGETGPGDAEIRDGRRMRVLEDWAAADPERALERSAATAEEAEWLSRGILEGDTSLATDALAAIDDAGARARLLLTTGTSLGNNHVTDYFPTPHERNRLPDFEARYHGLLAALEAGQFEDGQERSLRRALHRSFQNQVPAAKLAYEEAPAESGN